MGAEGDAVLMWQLTKQERMLWEAFPAGRRVTLGDGDAEHGAQWGQARVVRAEVIRALVARSRGATREGVPAIRLNGARITGSLDLRFATVEYALSLRSCYFDSKVELHGVRCREIDFTGSYLPHGLRASTADIDGHLMLDRATVDNSVRLIAAHIRGALFMDGAHLSGVDSAGTCLAFEADIVKIDGDMQCRDGFRTEGEMRLPGAVIGDSLCLEGAHLANAGRCALQAARSTIGGDLLCGKSFVAEGEMDLADAVIEGRLSLEGANLCRPGGQALNASRLRVHGELRGSPWIEKDADGKTRMRRLVVEGEFRLLNARLSGPFIMDGARFSNPDGVALHASGLVADGMYCRRADLADGGEKVGFEVGGEIRLSGARITGPVDFTGAGLKETPSLSLGCWYLTARELILLFAESGEGIIDLRYAQVGLLNFAPDRPPKELRLDGLTYNSIAPTGNVGQGLAWLRRASDVFRPQPYEQLAETYRRGGHDAFAREVLLAKERARRAGLSPPAKLWGHVQDVMVGYGYRPWRAAGWLVFLLIAGTVVFSIVRPVAAETDNAPHFTPFVYTLDHLLPIVDLGLRKAYVPVHEWQQWFSYGLVIMGWILATTIAAAITRALRRQ
jgi:hypothetical protein